MTATETRATGIPWAFAPCVCVTRDPRWGRSYESFGEDPALVSQLETIITGLQGKGKLAKNTSVLATAKHFLGDGGTKYGSSTTGNYKIDQGVTYVTQSQLDALYLAPFKTAVKDGRRLGHAVLLEPADHRQGRRADQDACPRRPDHRRAEEPARVQGFRHQRLRRHRPDQPRLQERREDRHQRRPGHDHGAEQLPDVHHGPDCAERQRRCHHRAHRRRGHTHPDPEVRARAVRPPVRRPQQRGHRSVRRRTGPWRVQPRPSRRCC